MKKIVCELCESTEFVKEGSVLVCQGCGTRYTLDEAKSMMREYGHVSTASLNQQQIDNLLVLANNAFEANNNEEMEYYCNKIIEIDATRYEVWLTKGQAIGWQSTYSNPRVIEAASAMRKGVDVAPQEKKEKLAKQAIGELCRMCTALAALAKGNFSDSPTEENRLKFGEFLKLCGKVTDMFCYVSEDVKQFATDKYREHKQQSAEYMNSAGVAAINMARKAWNALEHPNEASWETYIQWYSQIWMIFDDSINWGIQVKEKDEEIIRRFKNRIVAIEDPIDSKYYKYFSDFYGWMVDGRLSDSSKATRRKAIKESEAEITKIENKAKEKREAEKRAAEEAKKARIETYWKQHKEEKEKLDVERKNLEIREKEINSKIADLDKQLNAAAAEETEQVPAEVEESKIYEQIRDLEGRRAKLSIFAGKEKKRIAEDILVLQEKISNVRVTVEAEKKAKLDEIKARVEPLKAEKDKLSKELPAIKRRMSVINTELSKDRS